MKGRLINLQKALDEPSIQINLRQHCFIANWENKEFENLKNLLNFAQKYK